MSAVKTTKGTLLIPYIRVSRIGGRRVEDRITERVQLQAMEDYISNGRTHLRLDTPVVEVDASGANVAKRPGFEAAIARIKDPADAAQGIIVMKLNRFARSTFDAAKLSKEIKEANGVLVSAQEEIDFASPQGKFQFDLMAALAELELNQLRETWKQNIGYLVNEKGMHISRYVPFGYAKGDDRRLYRDPTEAPVLREAFERAAGWREHPRHSWTMLADFMNGSGFAPHGTAGGLKDAPRNSTWARSTVVAMIQNRVYLGEARASGPERDTEGNARYHLDFVNPEAHEPLVTHELWEAANAAREGATERRTGEIAAQASLRGLVICAGCGHKMVVTGQKAKDENGHPKRVALYYCRRLYADGVCPTGGSIQARKLQEYIESVFLESLEQPVMAIRPATESKLPELENKLTDARQQLRHTHRNLTTLAAGLSDEEVDQMIEEQVEAIDQLRDEIASERARTEIRAGINTGELKAHWKSFDLVQKRRYLQAAFESISIKPAGGKRGKWAPSAEERVREIVTRDGLFG
jgi:site-specific DNA recombinase